jgi:translocation and assembly module TamB
LKRALCFIVTALCLMTLPLTLVAQEDDKGFLTRKLEELLSGAGREVTITGFSGALSSQATFDTLTIADDTGIWLTLQDVVLDWNRSALLRGRLEVEELTAARISLPRLPNPDPNAIPSPEAGGFSLPNLPVAIEITKVAIAQVDLGTPVLGEAVQLAIEASATLNDTGATTQIAARRTDTRRGQFEIAAAFTRATQALDIDITLDEASNGIAARLLAIPGAPALQLDIDGTGPLSDFTADIALRSDGAERIGGKITLLRPDAPPVPEGGTPAADPPLEIIADLGGDITALLAPKYQSFFGPDVRLRLDALRRADGAVSVNSFSLGAQSLQLEGTAELSAQAVPLRLAISGTIAAPDGAPVLLPLGGGDTRVRRVALNVDFDATTDDRFVGAFILEGLDRADLRADQATLRLTGRLDTSDTPAERFAGLITVAATGLDLTNADMQAATGAMVRGQAQVRIPTNGPVQISDLSIAGEDYSLTGSAGIGGVADGLPVDLDLALTARRLDRFSAIAAQDLGGAASLGVKGQITLLAGTFDLAIDGTGQDLALGIDAADTLLLGQTQLTLRAARDTDGTRISDLSLANPAITLSGQATLQTGTSTADLSAKLANIGLLMPPYSGAVTADLTARQSAQGWTVALDTDGPFGATTQVSGLATGPDAALTLKVAVPDLGVLVPDISGPLGVTGTATRRGTGWRLDTDVQGPGGLQAAVAGIVQPGGRADLRARGTLPLGLSAPFLAPRALRGTATFDLGLNGPLALSSVSGTVTARDAGFIAPNLRISLAGIGADIRISGGTAQLDVSGALATGGRLSVAGTVGLGAGLPGDLRVQLASAVLTDPALYSATLQGQIDVRGPLAGGAAISGQITVEQADVSVPSTGIGGAGAIPDITHIGDGPATRATRVRAGLENTGNGGGAAKGGGKAYPLNITINAPARIFVRGRGLDTELGGQLLLSGTTAAPLSSGQFTLLRGHIDILTKRFEFVEGAITFQGSPIPYLRFVTRTPTANGEVRVVIEGPATEPEVTFESTPEAPQDEVLAQLLLGRSLSEISPLQALQLANAVATLSGRGGGGIIAKLREGFGLGDLDVTTDSDGTTGVRVGKYLSENVYTDLTANSDGTSEVTLNLDLSPSLTVRGSAESSGNSGLGIFFERDY